MRGTVVLHRPARMLPPPVPVGEAVILAPPSVQPTTGMLFWPQLLFPLVTILGSAYFIVYNPNPTYIAISVTMALASVALSVGMITQQLSSSRRQQAHDRTRYLRYLWRMDEEARTTAQAQEDAARFTHPGQTERYAIACDRVRVWERRLAHPDFATARIGLGAVPLATPLRLDGGNDPMGRRQPELLEAAERLVEEHQEVPDQPVLLDLRQQPVVSLVGPPETTREIARAIVSELTTMCAPDDLLLAVCHPPEADADWRFVRWLPHVVSADHPELRAGDGPKVLGMLTEEVARRRDRARRRTGYARDRSGDEFRQPQLILVIDGYSASSPLTRVEALQELVERAGDLDASLLFLAEAQRDEPPKVDVRVHVDAAGVFRIEDGHSHVRQGWVEDTDPLLDGVIARSLAPLRLSDREASTALRETNRLVELLGLASARSLDARARWAVLAPADLLRVPIGLLADGGALTLDLKESAQDGMGPHGLVIGATGSGKSELLRTLVTALAITHPPETLGFVLVDFKGGAAFAGLAELPQVAGVITNLADDLTMVDRMHSALFGEMQRRQALLRDAGNLDGIGVYQQRRGEGKLPGSQPLPYLLVIVDEFGELLASRPDFIDLFVAIGRVGRSLGMHLLLASQRLDEGRLRGLEGHLSYRIALRTFTGAESHSVIGSNDAYLLPPVPGSAYLKVHTEIFERFRGALVSGPDVTAEQTVRAPERPRLAAGLAVLGAEAPPAHALEGPAEPSAGTAAASDRPTDMAVVVERVVATGAAPVHRVWLPPLPARLPLSVALPPLIEVPGRGLQAGGWPALGTMRAPLGVVDLPEEQAQRSFIADFAGWAGHLAVVGAPQTGKSTLLRSLALALAVTHTPDEAQIYAIDYGGGSLFGLARLPHVGDVAGRVEPEKMRRTLHQVWSLVDERDALFREAGIDSPETLRRRREEGTAPPGSADVFLFIDGWGALRDEIEDQEADLRDIASRGLRVGCHLVLTANRWNEIRPNLRDLISGRLELRLNDPSESEIDRRAAAAVSRGVPGRALNLLCNLVQVATPDLGRPLEEVAVASARAWRGERAPAVRLLPARLTAAELAANPGARPSAGVPIGVDEFQLAPVHVDLDGADPHFLVLGDAESGKTTFLRSWLGAIQERQGPERAMFLVIDYRRTLLGAVRPEQLWAYCGAAPQASAAINELATGIVERLPPSTLTPEAIAARSWWSGPDFYIVVDDYDLVVSPSGNPMAPLVELLAQGRDLGLHVVLTRRVGGMARAIVDPLLNRLRELHAQGLILSGEPAEGPILGMQRATHQPPGRGVLVRRRMRPLLVQTVTAEEPRPDHHIQGDAKP